jgi:sigma-B regulation protein RsbU (phosphoserine phosphatase)
MSANAGASIIMTIAPPKAYGATLAKLIESYSYVDGAAKAAVVAEALRERSDLRVIGVLDGGRFDRVLDRERFFSALGRPYGWDILSKEPVSSFSAEVRTFGWHENIFSVAERLRQELKDGAESYYGVSGADGGFGGVFSSRSLLLYLALLSQKDVEMAGALQERLVNPRMSFDDGRFAFRAYSRAAKGMGGDFYFSKPIGRSRSFVALGDVSGKGAAASIVTSLLWGMFRMFDFRRGLKALLLDINEAIVQTFHLERHLTGVFMVWDFEAMNASIADMGHGLYFLVRAGRYRRLRLPAVNLPLGIEPELDIRLFRFPIMSGDIFCAYTDGLVEQRNPEGAELGSDIIEELVTIENSSPEAVLDTVSKILDRFRANMPQTDDATWIQVEVK